MPQGTGDGSELPKLQILSDTRPLKLAEIYVNDVWHYMDARNSGGKRF
jgi:hypothetical protein